MIILANKPKEFTLPLVAPHSLTRVRTTKTRQADTRSSPLACRRRNRTPPPPDRCSAGRSPRAGAESLRRLFQARLAAQ
jgi:hypothetical protein